MNDCWEHIVAKLMLYRMRREILVRGCTRPPAPLRRGPNVPGPLETRWLHNNHHAAAKLFRDPSLSFPLFLYIRESRLEAVGDEA